MSNALYTGEDVEVSIDLIDQNFADVTDVIVGVIVGKELKKTLKKTSSGANQVVAVGGNPTMCKFRLFRTETRTWLPGMLTLEVTVKSVDPSFPDGKHSTYKENIVPFSNTMTKDV